MADEPDFDKRLRNVLNDLHEDILGGPEDAYEAITEHPGFKNRMRLQPMKVRG